MHSNHTVLLSIQIEKNNDGSDSENILIQNNLVNNFFYGIYSINTDTEILNNTIVQNTVGIMDQSITSANIRYNIIFNFPGIEELIFTIEGQQVHTPPYRGLDGAE